MNWFRVRVRVRVSGNRESGRGFTIMQYDYIYINDIKFIKIYLIYKKREKERERERERERKRERKR